MDAVVFIVDDDSDMRESLVSLIESVGFRTRTFANPQAFLHGYDANVPSCVLLDIRMPEMDGLDVQHEMRKRGCEIPVIMITAYGDVQGAVRAFQDGAFDFVEKPFASATLISRVREAIDRDATAKKRRDQRERISLQVATLTPKEREIFRLLVEGNSLVHAAKTLERSIKTVEAHATRVKKKLGAKNRVELVRLALTAGFVDNTP